LNGLNAPHLEGQIPTLDSASNTSCDRRILQKENVNPSVGILPWPLFEITLLLRAWTPQTLKIFTPLATQGEDLGCSMAVAITSGSRRL
jgi:hypothetical protein